MSKKLIGILVHTKFEMLNIELRVCNKVDAQH